MHGCVERPSQGSEVRGETDLARVGEASDRRCTKNAGGLAYEGICHLAGVFPAARPGTFRVVGCGSPPGHGAFRAPEERFKHALVHALHLPLGSPHPSRAALDGADIVAPRCRRCRHVADFLGVLDRLEGCYPWLP
mmetsp:Transcript_108341/g.312121  ORF Transcript_108341/g.312121 Transcript_108341/m.312121 type:complete len:136 (+) Transcript_108341:325-732(+)